MSLALCLPLIFSTGIGTPGDMIYQAPEWAGSLWEAPPVLNPPEEVPPPTEMDDGGLLFDGDAARWLRFEYRYMRIKYPSLCQDALDSAKRSCTKQNEAVQEAALEIINATTLPEPAKDPVRWREILIGSGFGIVVGAIIGFGLAQVL